MIIKEYIAKDSIKFQRICRDHQVKVLYAFGSSVSDKFKNDLSDIDLVVEVDIADPLEKGETLLSLWDSLEAFFKRKVDLLTRDSILNPYLKKSIDSAKIVIYDRSGKEVSV
jgi:uncharacterized protein